MISTLHHRLPVAGTTTFLLFLVAFPWLAALFGQEFYIEFGSRLLIIALVASSLNLILGFGGLVSLGHAAYFGAGAYVVGILMHYGVTSAWIAWPAAVATGAILALIFGAISLRTRGVYFIMITLAFAQMTYYIFVSMRTYGGDDGLPLPQKSQLGIDLNNEITFYYVVLALGAVCMLAMLRLINSRFGRVLQAAKENETRMGAIGFSVYRYRLVCFVIAGAIAALGGALFANLNMMASPSQLNWVQSGTLMVMVIVGGIGHFFGGLIGAFLLLILEEILSGYTTHWALPVGFVLLAIVLFLPNGVASLFRPKTSQGDA